MNVEIYVAVEVYVAVPFVVVAVEQKTNFVVGLDLDECHKKEDLFVVVERLIGVVVDELYQLRELDEYSLLLLHPKNKF